MAFDDDRPREITRSEEELHHVGTRTRPVRRVRVRKRIVTEYVDIRVPLRREELVVFEEDLPAGPGAGGVDDDAPLGEDSLELVLHAEEPILDSLQVRVVPRERARVRLAVVTGEEELVTELRKEVVEVDEESPRW